MSDPITLAVVAMGAAAAGSAVSAVGSIKQGNAAYQAGYYQAAVSDNNAKIAEAQAGEAIRQGDVEQERIRREVAQTTGQQRAILAGLGQALNVGTAAQITADTAQAGALDVATIRRNAEREALGFHIDAQNFRSDAQLQRMGASSARTAGYYGAAGSLLSGVSNTASMGAKFKETSFKKP